MAKLEDKLFNRVIEGKLDAKEEIDSEAVKAVEGAESGTVASVLGLDSNGKLVKGAVSGGTQLYKHIFTIDDSDDNTIKVIIITSISEPVDTPTLNKIQTLWLDEGTVLGKVWFNVSYQGIITGIGNSLAYCYTANGNSFGTWSGYTLVSISSDTVTPL